MTGKYGDTILKAKKYIEENYADQNTTLTTVADAVAMSPNHFSTIFSHECKTTFIEYLTNVRIENAKRLMKETDMKGYDIAYECGFSDPHYFSYIFKKIRGFRPASTNCPLKNDTLAGYVTELALSVRQNYTL